MKGSVNFLESIDSGSNYSFGDKMERPQMRRSLFDLSHLVTTDIPNAGVVFPLTWFHTVLGDEFDINADALLRVLPQVVPLYSRQRLYLYAFWCPYEYLWDNANVFLSKGYSGTNNYSMPTMHKDTAVVTEGNTYLDFSNKTIKPNSLGDYLGLPQGLAVANSPGGAGEDALNNAGINALPFMMYLRIWRDYFINKNTFINDKIILPDDDSRFRLNNNGELLSAKDEGYNFLFNITSSNILGYTRNGTVGAKHCIFGLFPHLYPSDYFTSALPFTQRGEAPTLSGQASVNEIAQALAVNSGIDFSDSMVNDVSDTGAILALGTQANHDGLGLLANRKLSSNSPYVTAATQTSSQDVSPSVAFGDSDLGVLQNNALKAVLNKAKISNEVVAAAGATPIAFSIYYNDIRKLAQQQIELEKMARTDGSYSGFGLTFFGVNPRSAKDYKPIFVGGCYKNISFTEVLQTSGQTTKLDDSTEVNSSVLGSQAGHGITGINNGRIGHIYCDDFGILMILGCIMPDIYYSQGLEKKWTMSKQEDIYLPERSRLGMVPILNKEIFFAGNNGNQEGQDNYLWAYQNPFDDMRYMQNRICGKIADYSNNSFRSFTQARHFTQLPNWGREFIEASDVRKDYLAAPSESAYTAQFQFNIRAVRPMPYKGIPSKNPM